LKCFKIDNKYIAEFSLHHENEAKETNENPISIVAQREESSETKQFISNLQAKHSQNEYKKIEFNCKELNETMAELKPREHEVLGRYNLPKDILLISLIENKH
jgi:DNA-directed RNA polymerase sigma subunit (sigma70/sigma32)